MRKFILMTAVMLLALSHQFAYANTRIKVATLAPQNSGWATMFRAGAEEINERTEGRVTLRFYWGGAQGSEKKVLQKIQIGQLQGGTFSPTDFQSQYPDVNIFGLPFFFSDYEEVAYVRERMDETLEAGFADLGYKTFGFAGGGFAYVLSNEPVHGYEDLVGKKVWLPQGDLISYEAMKSLRLSPVPLPLTDVLTGLQTGLIDIVAIPPLVALALQWHTKVKFVSRIPVLYSVGFMAISERTLKKLSDNDRAVVTDVLTRLYSELDAESESEANAATAALINVGVQDVVLTEGEFDRIHAKMEVTNRVMAEKRMYSLQLLEEMEQHLADYHRMRIAGSADAASESSQ